MDRKARCSQNIGRRTQPVELVHHVELVVEPGELGLDRLRVNFPVLNPTPRKMLFQHRPGALQHADFHAFDIDLEEIELQQSEVIDVNRRCSRRPRQRRVLKTYHAEILRLGVIHPGHLDPASARADCPIPDEKVFEIIDAAAPHSA